MINTVNIDLTNISCWGTSNAAGEGNEITLYIKLLESLLNKTDIKLEFTKFIQKIMILKPKDI